MTSGSGLRVKHVSGDVRDPAEGVPEPCQARCVNVYPDDHGTPAKQQPAVENSDYPETGASVNGRLLAQTAVTLQKNRVVKK